MAELEKEKVSSNTIKLTIKADLGQEEIDSIFDKIVQFGQVIFHSEEAIYDQHQLLSDQRLRAIYAVNMKAHFHIEQAISLLKSAGFVASGVESISSHGFPEFEDHFEYAEFHQDDS